MGLAILGFCAVLVEAWNQNTSWEWLKLGYNPVSDIYKPSIMTQKISFSIIKTFQMHSEQEFIKEHIPLPEEQLASWLPVLPSWPPLQLWSQKNSQKRAVGQSNKIKSCELWQTYNCASTLDASISYWAHFDFSGYTKVGLCTNRAEYQTLKCPSDIKTINVIKYLSTNASFMSNILLNNYRTHFKSERSAIA